VQSRPFSQVDVFTTEAFGGNPVAVVLDARSLDPALMQRFARWTNLSETTFLLPPDTPEADYQLRIFTANGELPFAGHPTLGSAHAWLEAGGTPRAADVVVQECGAGLVQIRRGHTGLAFAAPPLIRSGPAAEPLIGQAAEQLGIARDAVLDAEWVDNGPGWLGLLLQDAEAVLALRPRSVAIPLGVVGPYPPGAEAAVEVRAFFPVDGLSIEDPVTGSLNASLAGWLVRTGRLRTPYLARQGTVLGRSGRVHVSSDDDGAFWIGGGTQTRIRGEVEL
jgi:PhzF family phenazine biosynthesis protein